ncbi:hypothetical protein H5T87_04760 [bacterium]|nr:hypothetical protein [bacterium]
MRKGVFILLLLVSYFTLCVETKDVDDYIIFTTRDYQLHLYKTKGTFDFLVKDKDGIFHPIHKAEGESPWFGYNGPRGEVSSSRNPIGEIKMKRWREGYLVSILVPLEQGVFWDGEFYISDDYLVVRSLIKSEARSGISIVRLAPRFEVDIALFNRYLFSLPGQIVEGKVEELGRPGYAGVLGWGGPKSYGSLDPSVPFFALYNPELQVGFLFLYPFYDKLWKGKHIFLQLWEGGINYFYAGWGDENDLGKETVFVITPLKIFSPDEIKRNVEKLNKEIEELVRSGGLPLEFITRLLEIEGKLRKYWEISEKLLKEKLTRMDDLSEEEIKMFSDMLFKYQVLLLCSERSFEEGDYETALRYSEKMLKLLGINDAEKMIK